MNRTKFFLLILCLSLAACGGAGDKGEASDPAQGALAGAAIGGPFTLVNQDGKTVRWSDFRGKYRLIYFGYSYCPDVCPLDLQNIMQGFGTFAKADPARAAKVQPIFVSVDPERDTPAVLKAYVANFSPRLMGLTGTPEQIAAVARSFAVVYGREAERPGAAYLVSHSRTPYLFGPDGQPIALVPVDDAATPALEGKPGEVAAFLQRWVR